MKYIAVFDEEELTNDLRHEFNRYALTAKFNNRVKRLIPVVTSMIINGEGTTAYLTQGHIDCLTEYERQQMMQEMMDRLKESMEEDLKKNALSVEEIRKQFGFPKPLDMSSNAIVRLKDDSSDKT